MASWEVEKMNFSMASFCISVLRIWSLNNVLSWNFRESVPPKRSRLLGNVIISLTSSHSLCVNVSPLCILYSWCRDSRLQDSKANMSQRLRKTPCRGSGGRGHFGNCAHQGSIDIGYDSSMPRHLRNMMDH